jgi:hypothetical protein
MRRAEVHIYGIAEFRTVGTIVAFERQCWSVDRGEGRIVYATPTPETSGLKVGDRVEIEPSAQSTRSARLNIKSGPDWIIVRRLDWGE